MKMRVNGHNLMFHHCQGNSSTDVKEYAFDRAVADCPTGDARDAYNFIKARIPGGFKMLHVVHWGNGFRAKYGGPAVRVKNNDGKISAAIMF